MSPRLVVPADFPVALPDITIGGTGPAWLVGANPNLSLLFQRYFPARENQNAMLGCLQWFCNVAATVTKREDHKLFITELHEQRRTAFQGLGKVLFPRFSVLWRACVGIGAPSPVENSGWAFDPTYGMPVLPESSIKGILREFLSKELGEPPDKDRASFLFGEGGVEGAKGAIRIFSGWPLPSGDGWFEVDVITPHQKQFFQNDPPGNPRISEKPEPAHFLVLRKGTAFEIPIGLTDVGLNAVGDRGADGCSDLLEEAVAYLEVVLKEFGVGARTGSNYGRMEGVPQT